MEEIILGHFAVLEKIGSGGMGVVYRARDLRLERTVAIKALAESRSGDSVRKRRLLQEAKAASALNHPNIVTIHEILEQDGHSYIVMELIEGTPLNAAIPKRGMKLADALRVAAQVADALTAAHAAGIVHRDLKPANIMVDAAGRVKVLDFGLAKAAAADAIGESEETLTVSMGGPLTEEGTIVGSVPYMSPEQAEGKPVDGRSDIFSFGAVLYEMITGRQAFAGGSRTASLAAVLTRDPQPAGEIVAGLPPDLDRLISRCLRKDQTRRSQHMSDVKLALLELREESESGVAPAAARARGWRGPWLAAGAAALVLALAAGWFYRQRSNVGFRAPELVRLSPDDGYSYNAPAISPDGKLVAYVSDRSGKPELWLQQAEGTEPVQLTHAGGSVSSSAFFPDGTRILYQTDGPGNAGSLEIVPALGGDSRTLASGRFSYTSLSPDGQKIAYFHSAPGKGQDLQILPVDGGPFRTLPWMATQGGVLMLTVPQWTPDSRFVIYPGSKRPGATDFKDLEWFMLPVEGGAPIPMGAGETLRTNGCGAVSPDLVSADRVLLDCSGNHIWEFRLRSRPWRIVGPPRQLTFGTETESAASMSKAGVAAVETSSTSRELYLVEIDPATGQAASAARRVAQNGLFRRLRGAGGDPKSVYFEDVDERASDRSSLHELDLDSGRQKLLAEGLEPVYSKWRVLRDGQIAFSLMEKDRYSISVGVPGAPVGSAKLLCTGCGSVGASSPDGRFLLINTGPAGTQSGGPPVKRSVHVLEVATGKEGGWLDDPAESLTVLGNAGEGGQWMVVASRTPGAAVAHTYLAAWRVPPPPRTEWIEVREDKPHFSPSANLVYFFHGEQLMAMRFDTRGMGRPFEVKIPPGPVDLKSDGTSEVRARGIVFSREETKSSVWLMKPPM